MPRLRNRSAAIEVNGRRYDLSKFDVDFTVVNSIESNENTLDVSIWGLSEQTRSTIKKGGKIALEAGYAGSEGWLFAGDIVRPVPSLVPGEGWQMAITAGDGHKGMNAIMNVSIAPGAKVGDVLEQIGRAGGFSVENLKRRIAEGGIGGLLKEFKNGLTLSGNVKGEMEKIGKSIGKDISIQRGEFIVQDPAKADEIEVPVISEPTGLVGSPQSFFDQKNPSRNMIRGVCLLNPKVRAAGGIKLESKIATGIFKIQKVEHSGGSKSNDWYSTFEGYEIKREAI